MELGIFSNNISTSGVTMTTPSAVGGGFLFSSAATKASASASATSTVDPSGRMDLLLPEIDLPDFAISAGEAPSALAGNFSNNIEAWYNSMGYNTSNFESDAGFSESPLMNPGYIDTFYEYYQDRLDCGHFTLMEDDDKLHKTIDVVATCRTWTEGILSWVVAAFGLFGNLVSIWILSTPEMRNSFNRLLMALAIIDCLFILPGILIYTSKAFEWNPNWFNYILPLFLYPFAEIALCSSIFMTVAIAVERYIGLCRPLRRLAGRPSSAKYYIIPVITLAVLLNIPKFFESKIIYVQDPNDPFSNVTIPRLKITDLRTNPYYITYYALCTRLIVTGILPLVILALLNTKIYLSIRQSKQQLRILAIRSALPMAILSQNAPSVPVSPVNSCSNPHHGATCSSPKLSDYEESSTSSVPKQNNKPKTAKNVKNGTTVHHHHPVENGILVEASPDDQRTNSFIVNYKNPNKSKVVVTASKSLAKKNVQRSCSTTVAFPSSANNGGSAMSNKEKLRERFAKLRSRSTSATLRINTTPGEADSLLANNSSTRVISGQVSNNANGGQTSSSSSGINNADLKLAPILFGVVIVFVLCNSFRVILNIYDFSVLENIIECEKKGVGRFPQAWILCSISVSQLLLMVNSSVNFLVYCVAGTRFRRILAAKMVSFMSKRNSNNNQNSNNNNNNNNT